jgi:cell wall-associated NlpC family hydrolase
MYAMYVIGQVESNHNWSAVNRGDPITLGMMQWYGTRAYNLLNLGRTSDPTGWAAFKAATPALAAAVENNSYAWNGYYVTDVDANAWVEWSKRDENHQFQQATWDSDYNNYSNVCNNNGIPESNIKQRIYFMSMYHQGPLYAFQVLQTCGAMATLDNMHQTCLNNGVLGQYSNRYNTVYNLLKNWDGTSAPPDFGQIGTGGSGGNTPPPADNQPKPDKPILVQQFGDMLRVRIGSDVYTAYKSAAQTWQAGTIKGTSNGSGSTGGGTPVPAPTPDNNNVTKVLDWIAARVGKFAYSQGGGRLNPDQTGYTDCSGLLWAALHFAIGQDIGTWTGTQKNDGTHVCDSNSDSTASGIAKAKAGDILLIMWSGYNATYDHVEMFGNVNGYVYSHGGPGNGPNVFTAASQMDNCYFWEIRRVIKS